MGRMPSCLPTSSHEEVRAGREWLAQELGVNARYFAVPFGNTLPRAGARRACDVWLLSTTQLPHGAVDGRRVFNREDLMLSVPAAAASASRVTRLGHWVTQMVAAAFG